MDCRVVWTGVDGCERCDSHLAHVVISALDQLLPPPPLAVDKGYLKLVRCAKGGWDHTIAWGIHTTIISGDSHPNPQPPQALQTPTSLGLLMPPTNWIVWLKDRI